jgi:hypothetical protein
VLGLPALERLDARAGVAARRVIDWWRLLVISIGAEAPSSAMCVSAEWRNWWRWRRVGLEQLFGAPIRQPGGAVRCLVEKGGCGPGWPAGGEHQAGAAAFQQSGKQRGGAGRPGDPLDGPPLPVTVAAVGKVEVGDVEREDLPKGLGHLVRRHFFVGAARFTAPVVARQ